MTMRRWDTQDVDQPWSIGEAIGVGMRALRGHFLSLVLPVVVLQIIGTVLTSLPSLATIGKYGLKSFLAIGGAEPKGVFGAPLTPPVPLSALGGALATTVLVFLLVASVGL